jgi:hypothetical protein
VDPATGDLKGAISHINSVRPGGPRYDPSQTDDQRHGVENLILLCYNHHAEIDRNSYSYSVDFLRGVKRRLRAISGWTRNLAMWSPLHSWPQ